MIDKETGEILTDFPEDLDPAQNNWEQDPHRTYMPVFLRTQFNYDMNKASDETALSNFEPTLTQQNMRDSTDINVMMERFGITGQIPVLNEIPMQGDFTNITDFQSAMQQLTKSQNVFMTLPADMREKFHNNPHEFLDFTSKEENRTAMRDMGLLKPEPAPQGPIEVRVVPGTPGTPPAADKP